MKVIFLDIDGVLNCSSTKELVGGYTFVDDEKILILKEILDATNAKIVLTSTWRYGWRFRDLEVTNGATIAFTAFEDKCKSYGITLYDKTKILNEMLRGHEISNWLESHPEVEQYLILDDQNFCDYNKHKGHFLKTSMRHGLKPAHVKWALKILNKEQ